MTSHKLAILFAATNAVFYTVVSTFLSKCKLAVGSPTIGYNSETVEIVTMETLAPTLTLVVDRRLYRTFKDEEPLSLVEAAIAGGVTQVQLRTSHKDNQDDLGVFAIALRLREMTEGVVPFVVTGDLELAEKCHADGVLLTEKSYKPEAARKFLRGPQPMVGCYCQSVIAASRAERGGADYVQIGPIYTERATDDEGDLGFIRKVKDAILLPVVAFGGISTRDRVAAVIKAGADGVAVTSAILAAQHPRIAAQELRSVFPN
jgi:thiamine-phosphate pyrophosphorylase